MDDYGTVDTIRQSTLVALGAFPALTWISLVAAPCCVRSLL